MSLDDSGVTFKWKDYRRKGQEKYKTMSLSNDEFIRRFLLHVLPKGFHRIRHYGLIADAGRKDNLARARKLLEESEPELIASDESSDDESNGQDAIFYCKNCGSTNGDHRGSFVQTTTSRSSV